jgi:hypothetical protein
MIELTLAVIAVLGFTFQAYEIAVLDRCTACEIIDIVACGDEGQTYDPLAGECVNSRDLL